MTKEEVMLKDAAIDAGLKSAPAVGGSFLAHVSLNEWVAIITIFYVILQIVLILPKIWDTWSVWLGKKRAMKRARGEA